MTAFNASLTKPTSFKQTPFNQTAARFIASDYKSRNGPGPGQYRISGFADENLRRAFIESGKKPPFNVASIRRLNITRKDEFNTPGKIILSNKKKYIYIFIQNKKGPNSYDVKTQPFKSKMEHPSAIFISNTAREPIIEVNFID